jgi:hypothetical protein
VFLMGMAVSWLFFFLFWNIPVRRHVGVEEVQS